ncbi:HD domain-containing phosphohydrolase [Treponema sp. J25]|uniref:HD domain-containing phosphohydrolase n=1 Tax=Treponema sp. J25 TaxID=2094121 RepID=UPI001048D27E|nr:HD domain-containing phosphohydrolase [Treponema sp. J25]TCW62290.1 hypothetical protein C5O22_02140 [Treponema sp. J25]
MVGEESIAKVNTQEEDRFSKITTRDIEKLNTRLQIDLLDNYTTTTSLIQGAIQLIKKKITDYEVQIFVHRSESREYREILSEGIAAIPEDSLFVACLFMHNNFALLDDFYTEYGNNDPLIYQVLKEHYRVHFLYPVIHGCELVAIIFFCHHEEAPGDGPLPPPETLEYIRAIGDRLRVNLYSILMAEKKQQELLQLATYPGRIKNHPTITDIVQQIFNDIRVHIPFDNGIYYGFLEYRDVLTPISFYNLDTVPQYIERGKAVSGFVLAKKKALLIPDRRYNAYFTTVEEEPFLYESCISIPVMTETAFFGVLTLSRRIRSGNEQYSQEHLNALQIVVNFLSLEIDNRKIRDELEKSYFSTICALTNALEAKDAYTHGHSERVMKYAVMTAQELQLMPETVRKIRYAAMMHDIGKIGIKDELIAKTNELTEDESVELREHTDIGFRILEGATIFDDIRDLIKYHHEKMDGSGYYFLKKGEYPWEVMVIRIADIFDSLTTDRPHHPKMEIGRALDFMQHYIGRCFDQRVYDAFCRAIKNA